MPSPRSHVSRKYRYFTNLAIGTFSLLGIVTSAHASVLFGQPVSTYLITNSGGIWGNSDNQTASTTGTIQNFAVYLGNQATNGATNLGIAVNDYTAGIECAIPNAYTMPDGIPLVPPVGPPELYYFGPSAMGTWTGTNLSGCSGMPVTAGDGINIQFNPFYISGGTHDAPNVYTYGDGTSVSNIYWQAADSGGFPLDACMNSVATSTTISSNIGANTTWNANQTYVISGSVAVNSGKTLTILPCSVIKFASATSTLTVNGVLDAEGTSSPIYFTSYKDDYVGGDTNGDGASTTAAAGDWKSIVVGSTGSTTLSNVVVRYGGSAGTTSPMVYDTGGKLTVTGPNSKGDYCGTYIPNQSAVGTIVACGNPLDFSDLAATSSIEVAQ